MAKVVLRIPKNNTSNPSQTAPTPPNKKIYLKVKKPDIVAIDKDLDNNISSYQKDVVGFFNNYIDSPNYKERLLKQGYTLQQAEDAIKLRKANLSVTSLEKHLGRPEGSQYVSGEQKVYIDPLQWADYPNFSLRGVLGHEYSHVAGAMHPMSAKFPFPMKMNNKEMNEIESRNKLFKLKTAPENKINSIIHDRMGQEGKADMDALRFMMYKDGMYNTGTQEFNQDFLNKAKKKYSGDFNASRFFKNFSDQDIIWMMNNIAKNDTKQLDIA